MCEVSVADLSVPIDSSSDSESEQSEIFSSNTSDTKFEGEGDLPWECDDFKEFVDRKYRKFYFENHCNTVIVLIQDRRRPDEKVFHNLVISYKHDFDKKPTGKRYYGEASYTSICRQIFTEIFYNPTKCYVHWPGEPLIPNDHNSRDPLYCVRDWKNQTTCPIKRTTEKFYTLFAVKEHYHKLFTPAAQSKVYFRPEDQCHYVRPDSSVLFRKCLKKHVPRYKYCFLKDKEPDTGDTFAEASSSDTEFNEDFTGTFSDDTVPYDAISYTEDKDLSETEDIVPSNTDDFYVSVNRMHRKIKSDHQDTINPSCADGDYSLGLSPAHTTGFFSSTVSPVTEDFSIHQSSWLYSPHDHAKE